MKRLIDIVEKQFRVPRAKVSLFFANIYPPYLGAGISSELISEDFTSINVRLKKSIWTTNYVGTQFGGNLFSMSDPWLMLMLMHQLREAERHAPGLKDALGEEGSQAMPAAQVTQPRNKYIVWDKESSIRFRRPGTGDVHGRFVLTPHTVHAIRSAADESPLGIAEPTFTCHLVQRAEGKHLKVQQPTATVNPSQSSCTASMPALAFEGTSAPRADEEVVATVTKRLHVKRMTAASGRSFGGT